MATDNYRITLRKIYQTIASSDNAQTYEDWLEEQIEYTREVAVTRTRELKEVESRLETANARAAQAERERDAVMEACASLMDMEGFTELNIDGYLITLAPDGGNVNLEVGAASVENAANATAADGGAE